MTLYTYWRSSAAYRLRIALALKGLDPAHAHINLGKDGGEQLLPDFHAVNPQNLLPALQLDNGRILTQSLAIIEYLEEIRPNPSLLPTEPVARAQVRALCQAIVADIHPLNNLRILKYLKTELGLDQARIDIWYRHWITIGFRGVEELLARNFDQAPFCCGKDPSMADVCLVPQVYNARRFKVDLTAFRRIQGVEKACLELNAFAKAQPEVQGDARPSES